MTQETEGVEEIVADSELNLHMKNWQPQVLAFCLTEKLRLIPTISLTHNNVLAMILDKKASSYQTNQINFRPTQKGVITWEKAVVVAEVLAGKVPRRKNRRQADHPL